MKNKLLAFAAFCWLLFVSIAYLLFAFAPKLEAVLKWNS